VVGALSSAGKRLQKRPPSPGSTSGADMSSRIQCPDRHILRKRRPYIFVVHDIKLNHFKAAFKAVQRP
jgi:hypothetical protein